VAQALLFLQANSGPQSHRAEEQAAKEQKELHRLNQPPNARGQHQKQLIDGMGLA
jgi:hypothetical protein